MYQLDCLFGGDKDRHISGDHHGDCFKFIAGSSDLVHYQPERRDAWATSPRPSTNAVWAHGWVWTT